MYGGMVNAMAAAPLDEARTRIVVSAESANSLFYGDVDHSLQDPFSPENFQFRVVPDFDANANFGVLSAIAAHRSGKIFVGHHTGLYTCDAAEGTRTKLRDGPVQGLLISEDTLIGLQGAAVFTSQLSETGEASSFSGPFDTGFDLHFYGEIAVHPVNRKLYVLDDQSGTLIKSSQDFDQIDAENTFTNVQTPAIPPVERIRFGIGPDGRLFLAAPTDTNNKRIYYSDDDGERWQVVETGVWGIVGQLAFIGPPEDYIVLCGSALSTGKGEAGSWTRIPRGGAEDSHPNDGASCADPNNPNAFYFTTDAGFGATLNRGVDIRDVVQGLAAVQINDFDMNLDKTVAWTASKSGVRIATGFPEEPVWSQAFFPNDDGSPYYSVAVDRADPSGMTAYVGNCRIYKTEDGGRTWTLRVSFEEDYSVRVIVSSLEAAGDLVLAGLYSFSPGQLGGLLVSEDGGENFSRVLLGEDEDRVNVNDVLLTEEDGNPVAYVAAAADPEAVTGGGHVHRFVPGAGAEKIELDDGPVSIRSLAKTPEGGIYASGMTETFSPAVYYKAPGSDEWVPLPTDGLPEEMRPGGPDHKSRGPVVAVGFDSMDQPVPIVAIGVKLYYLPVDSVEWFTSPEMEYPQGTQLNVLFWDELMVGTDIGLFSHETVLDMPDVEDELKVVAADFDGDKRCDLAAADQDGNWYFWPSRAGYRLFGPVYFPAAGSPGAGDFDGDGRADPFVLRDDGKAVAFLSGGLYRMNVIFSTESQGIPVVADFDGDRRPDVAIVDELENEWSLWLSSRRYVEPVPLQGVSGEGMPTAGDFDGDRKADPVLVDDESGEVTLWPSKFAYLRKVGPVDLGMTGEVLAGDFDGDGIADFADLREDGVLYLRLSRARWASFGPISLPMPEE